MRKREHFIGLWLDDTEHKHLLKQCTLSGLNASALIRHSVMGVNIQPKPPDTYADLLRELSAIGNNLNQIARKAQMLNMIDVPQYRKAVGEFEAAVKTITEAVILPRKMGG